MGERDESGEESEWETDEEGEAPSSLEPVRKTDEEAIEEGDEQGQDAEQVPNNELLVEIRKMMRSD